MDFHRLFIINRIIILPSVRLYFPIRSARSTGKAKCSTGFIQIDDYDINQSIAIIAVCMCRMNERQKEGRDIAPEADSQSSPNKQGFGFRWFIGLNPATSHLQQRLKY